MYNYIKGVLVSKKTDHIVIEVSGLGYEIYVSLNTYSKLPNIDKECKLYLKQIVKEDSITLYGFIDEEEKNMFEMLTKISKVGPKLALSILSGFDLDTLKKAISDKNASKLSTIPGIGKKTAERIVLELKDKLGELSDKRVETPLYDDLLSALLNLGYKKQECVKILNQLELDSLSFENALKHALKSLNE